MLTYLFHIWKYGDILLPVLKICRHIFSNVFMSTCLINSAIKRYREYIKIGQIHGSTSLYKLYVNYVNISFIFLFVGKTGIEKVFQDFKYIFPEKRMLGSRLNLI